MLQVVIATMNRKEQDIPELKKQLNLEHASVLFVNQCDHDSDLLTLNETTELICSSQRGISRSRNLGISCASKELVLIGDDDLIYLEGFEKKVIQAFEKNPDASVVCFKSNKKNLFLNDKQEVISPLTMSSVYSVQIAFRLNDLRENKICFNELFGTGSNVFSSGEENILISECLSHGLKCIYVPEEILYVPESESSWFHGFDESYFISKGALLHKLYGKCSFPVFLAFALLKKSDSMSFLSRMKAMIKGKKQLIDLESRDVL